MLKEPRSPSPEFGKDTFQVQKVFIKNIDATQRPAETQEQVYAHFAQFGQIIDFKVFQNRGLIRKERNVRVHQL